MKKHKFTNKNIENIKADFFCRINPEEVRVINTKRRKSPAGVILAAALALCFAIGSLASTNMLDMRDLYSTFFGDGAEGAGFSINNTFESNGIELKLLSAVVDGNNGYIFFTVQDLVGDRLDDKMGWAYCKVDFHGMFKGHLLDCSINQLSYDEETKTITAVTSIQSTKGISVNDKMTFTLGTLESGLSFFDKYETGVSLYDLWEANQDIQTTTADEYGITAWAGPIGQDLSNKQVKAMSILKKNGLSHDIDGIDWARLTGIGFIDNQLHLQYQYTENRRDFNGGSFSLYNRNGEEIKSTNALHFGENRLGYVEHVYDIGSPEELRDISLKAQFNSSAGYIDGQWNISFLVDSKVEQRELTVALDQDFRLKDMVITASPITTTAKMRLAERLGDDSFDKLEEIFSKGNYLKLMDGTHIELTLNNLSLDNETGKIKVVYLNTFFDVNSLESVVIQGKEYFFE